MDIAIDIGNSFYKAYFFEKYDCIDEFVNQDNLRFIDYITLKMQNIKCRLIVSSVRKDDDVVFRHFATYKDCIVLDSKLKYPVVIDYKCIDKLGKDRLANVCGAVNLFPKNDILVVDAGTAITYDFIEKGTRYIGGNISPGLDSRYRALNTFTGNLPLLSIDYNEIGLIGNDTKSAIRAGVQYGAIFEVEMYLKKIHELYSDPVVVFTGGDAFFFANSIKNDIFVENKLTAIGLLKILEFNA